MPKFAFYYLRIMIITSKILTNYRKQLIITASRQGRPNAVNQKTELLRSLKFLMFSVSAGMIEIVTFALLNETLGWPYWPCYLIALVLSVIWNFTLNRRYTFRSANNVPVAMAKVFLFYLIFTPASTVFGNWLAEGLHWNEYLVTGINMILNFVLEFLYDRFFVFRDSIDTNSIAQKQNARK